MRQLKSPYGCRECGRTLEYVFDGHLATPHGPELVFACLAHPHQEAVYVTARYWRDQRPGRGEPEDYRLPASLIHQMEHRRRDLSGHARLSPTLDDGIAPVLEAFAWGVVEEAAVAAHQFLESTNPDHAPEKEDAFDAYLRVREARPSPDHSVSPLGHLLSAGPSRRLTDALLRRRWIQAEAALRVWPVTVYRVYCRRLLDGLRDTWITDSAAAGVSNSSGWVVDHPGSVLVYVFRRGEHSIRAELAGDEGQGFTLTLTLPDGSRRIDSHATSSGVYVRWLEVQEALWADGWVGPEKRDR